MYKVIASLKQHPVFIGHVLVADIRLCDSHTPDLVPLTVGLLASLLMRVKPD